MAESYDVAYPLASVVALSETRRTHNGSPYSAIHSLWEDHLQAHEAATSIPGRQGRMNIFLRHLNVLVSGRVTWSTGDALWMGGKWVSPHHDPKYMDPEYQEYLRLKRIFE